MRQLTLFHILPLILIVLVAFVGLRPLFHPGLYTAHDIWHQVARLYHYSESLRAGIFPPRWVPVLANGFGYPLFYFSYHSPWFVAAPLVLLGFSVASSLKITFGLAYLFSGLGMYLLALHLTKSRLASVTASLLYLIAPYQFFTLYVSTAIGTAFQLSLLPWLFLGIVFIWERRYRLGLPLLACLTALSILSHLLTFTLIAGFSLLISLGLLLLSPEPLKVKTKPFIVLGISALLGCLLAAFYLIPFFTEVKSIKAAAEGSGFAGLYESNFVNLKQLIYSKWGFGPITSNAKDGEISFQIGIAQWLGVVLLSLLLPLKRILPRRLPIPYLLLGGFLISIFLMLNQSAFIWDRLAQIISFDYPFRLLLISVFCGSLTAGYLILLLRLKWLKLVLSFLLIIIALYTNRNHIRVNLYTDVPLSLYVESETTTNSFHEYLPQKADGSLLNGKRAITEPAIDISVFTQTPKFTQIEVNNPQTKTISLPQFDFPGQVVTVDGVKVNHSSDARGRMSVELIAGEHAISIFHQNTRIIILGNLLSGLTAIGIIIYLIYPKLYESHRRHAGIQRRAHH